VPRILPAWADVMPSFVLSLRLELPGQESPMSRDTPAPFVINKDADGNFRLTVRDTRYNSQNYPIVTSTMQSELFAKASEARAFAKDNFNAEPGQFATK